MPIDPRIVLGIQPPPSPAEIQQQQLQTATAQQELQTRAQAFGDAQKVRAILGASGGDLEKALPQIMATSPELGLKFQTALNEGKKAGLEFQTAKLTHDKSQLEFIGQTLQGTTDDASWLLGKHKLQAAGIDVSDLPDAYDPAKKAQVISQGQTLKDAVDDRNKKLERDQGQQRIDALAAQQATVDARTEAHQTTVEAETAQHNRATEAIARSRAATAAAAAQGEQAVPTLTPEGMDVAATNYAKTGQLPAMGMSKQSAGVRAKIINRAAELFPGMDLATNRAGFASDEGSLKALQKQRDAISAFETTAGKNIDLFLGTAGKVVDTGSPFANSLARAVSGKMLGSSNQAQYDAARQVAMNEVAKIVSNPNLSGQLSDSARKEVTAFNPDSATLAQSVAVMRILKQDMANRAGAYDAQLAEIKGRLKGSASTTPATTTTTTTTPAAGALSYQDYLKSKGKQ